MTECSRQVLISVCLSREAHAPSSFGFSFSSSIWRIGNASLPADLLQIVKVSSLVWYVSCKFNYVVTVAASAAFYHFIQLTILLTVGSVAAAIYWFWAVWSGRMCMPGMMNFRALFCHILPSLEGGVCILITWFSWLRHPLLDISPRENLPWPKTRI